MKRVLDILFRLLDIGIITATANMYLLQKNESSGWWCLLLVCLFLVLNVSPQFFLDRKKTAKLTICHQGCELLYGFLGSLVVLIIVQIMLLFGDADKGFVNFTSWTDWLFHILCMIFTECIVFWNGIIRVYVTSNQLGMKWRVLGIVCGWIPIVHFIALGKILQVAGREVQVENSKILLNESRKEEEICATKYPILLVHGVFFRDFRFFNYWGRIPKELEENGAVVYYGNQQSAASVTDCGKELAQRILQIRKDTGCEKVNIIAHSKGGLDARYAIAMCGIEDYVASLTTINTPHRGCEFADYLLSKVGEPQKQMIADAYNTALGKLGDKNPDFLAAVTDLTSMACSERNYHVKDSEKVYYQSFGSKLNVASGGRFPLNLTNRFVEYFDGENDGLVGEKSFCWGESYEFLTVKGKRGISHGDVIDLNRENFQDFDVREFYVQLVADLKRQGF